MTIKKPINGQIQTNQQKRKVNLHNFEDFIKKTPKRPIKTEKYITVYHRGVLLTSIELWFLHPGPRRKRERRKIDALLTKSISTLLQGKTVSDAPKQR